jgi:hypothetical protein
VIPGLDWILEPLVLFDLPLISSIVVKTFSTLGIPNSYSSLSIVKQQSTNSLTLKVSGYCFKTKESSWHLSKSPFIFRSGPECEPLIDKADGLDVEG